MGSYSPGDPASLDNEATRPLRAGTPARDGATRSPGNFFVRLRAAWKSMRESRGIPRKSSGIVPHLRSRLIAILVAALGIACLVLGLSTYVTLQNSLYQQAQSDLKETSHRVVQTDLPRRQARRSGLQRPAEEQLSLCARSGVRNHHYLC